MFPNYYIAACIYRVLLSPYCPISSLKQFPHVSSEGTWCLQVVVLWSRVLKKINASRPLRALVRAVEEAMPCASLPALHREALEDWKRRTFMWLAPPDPRTLVAEGKLCIHDYLLLCNNRDSGTVSVTCGQAQTSQTACLSSGLRQFLPERLGRNGSLSCWV